MNSAIVIVFVRKQIQFKFIQFEENILINLQGPSPEKPDLLGCDTV
jgi:hypothetical protein